MELTSLILFERKKLNCGVYIIAFECLSKLFYSLFSIMTTTGQRQAMALSSRMVRANVKASMCPAVACQKNLTTQLPVLHAGSDVPILVTGESGTGKELLARAIHAASPRAEQPFLPVNMAALANELFDAEFFGHTKGAFTGAEKERAGHLKHCNHGTLFLDEIGNLRPPVKADDPGVAERIAKRLVHLTKYFNVQALTAPESEEGQLLRVELLPPSAEGKESGPPVYPPETKVTLKVTNALTPNPDDINDPTRILNITILNLQADWGITQIFPKGAGASEQIDHVLEGTPSGAAARGAGSKSPEAAASDLTHIRDKLREVANRGRRTG
jgi:hypothetical protein